MFHATTWIGSYVPILPTTWFASFAGHHSVVEYLLEQQATVNYRNVHGINAVVAAARGQHLGVLRTLLKKGGRPNVQLKADGNTALHVATAAEHSAVVAVLLEGGADPRITNEEGLTPTAIAQKKRNFEIIKLLGKYEKAGDAVSPAGQWGGSSGGGGGESGEQRSTKGGTSGVPVADVGGAAKEEEEGDEELPQVVMVGRMVHEGTTYLVDRGGSGKVYSNNIEDPEEVGTWTKAGGVVLFPSSNGRGADADDGHGDEVHEEHNEL
jgi:hypothetical protein